MTGMRGIAKCLVGRRHSLILSAPFRRSFQSARKMVSRDVAAIVSVKDCRSGKCNRFLVQN